MYNIPLMSFIVKNGRKSLIGQTVCGRAGIHRPGGYLEVRGSPRCWIALRLIIFLK